MDPAAGERRGGRNDVYITSASGSERKLEKPSTRGGTMDPVRMTSGCEQAAR
jgi:hypothetical protein